ncbi:cell wall hydrolase [uncultured Sphingomonas sp.]|uniref:cell wall hydrolase n=1 Tax=uncultured Sphingomonas sp. TaxID=158754 RepID=UPI0025D0B4A3|nr:cell wall hydrolase [uncultured Sphingomonas sp.]
MLSKRLATLSSGTGVALLAVLTFHASAGSAAEIVAAPTLTYDLDSTAPQSGGQSMQATLTPAVQTVDLGQPDEPAAAEPRQAAITAPAASDQTARICMAKVVLHEAGNQSRDGKIAVAQTLVNRLRDGRFGDSICDVANQPGQFFNLSGYNPSRDSDRWADAMNVAEYVLGGEADAIAPGAMFFRANYARSNGFFRGRKRIASVGAHVFYR